MLQVVLQVLVHSKKVGGLAAPTQCVCQLLCLRVVSDRPVSAVVDLRFLEVPGRAVADDIAIVVNSCEPRVDADLSQLIVSASLDQLADVLDLEAVCAV